ncbi:MAG: hypothetical protein QM811_24515 [Pirellulales bacterium]
MAGWYKLQREKSDDANLKTVLAEIRVAQRKYAEAAQGYREAVDMVKVSQPPNAARLKNNLAYVLALTGDKANLAEAAKAIDEAIRWLGPQSDLLDTRGMVALMSGDYAKAEVDFQEAVLSPSAAKWFRLACARMKLGKKDEAKLAYLKARDLQFDPRDLSPIEQPLLKELLTSIDADAVADRN